MSLTQRNRIARIKSPLGEDVLLLSSFSASEELGRLFEINAEFQSEDHQVKFEDIIGQNVTIEVELPNEETRYFNGYVNRFSHAPIEGRLANYRATIVPALWFLTRTSDCRIFQDKTVPEIIKDVLRDKGLTDFEDKLKGDYKPWTYCVQYRETAFNFLSRLMEEEGIYYHFVHENGKHTLHFVDSTSTHEPFSGHYETIVYRNRRESHIEEEYIYDWHKQQEVQAGKCALADFNFTTPRVNLGSSSEINRSYKNANFELFDYPGEYADQAEGDRYARLRIEEVQARQGGVHAAARCLGIAAGCVFTMEEHPRDDENAKYLVTSAHYHVSVGDYESGESDTEASYHCNFTAGLADEPFRSQRLTPKPIISGPQTAIVVGPTGEEIHTDEYGRVKCQFHWDRYSEANETSSCWIRVAQIWAGKKWGSVYTPRIGHEVIVEFLEGDPNRPIVVGRLYNAESMPPYALPANKTISTIKSNSSRGGKGFNELRFEDNKGKEQVFIHAERNHDTRVKNSSFEHIGNERHLIVKKYKNGGNQFEKVEGDKHGIVEGDQLRKVDGDDHLTVEGDKLAKVNGSESLQVGGDQMIKTTRDQNLKAGMDINTEAGMNISRKAGMDVHDKAGMNYALDAGMAHIKAGLAAVIEAGVQLTLKVGGNFIDINPAGIFIQGTMVMINSGGAAGSGSGCSPTAPAAPDPPDPPEEAKEAARADPGEISAPAAKPKPPKVITFSPSAQVLQTAARDGTPFCET